MFPWRGCTSSAAVRSKHDRERFHFGFPILSLVGFRSQSRKAILPLLTLILRLLLGFLCNVKGPCAAPEGVSHNRTGTL